MQETWRRPENLLCLCLPLRQMLDQGSRLAHEARQMGEATIGQLQIDGERLRRVSDGVDEVNSHLTTADAGIGRMRRRERVTKVIIWGSIIALILIIVMVLYFKVF